MTEEPERKPTRAELLQYIAELEQRNQILAVDPQVKIAAYLENIANNLFVLVSIAQRDREETEAEQKPHPLNDEIPKVKPV